MKLALVFAAVSAVFAGNVATTKNKKTLVEIATRGKIMEVAENFERIINNGLTVDDIVDYTPKLESAIPELIEEGLVLLPVLKEIVSPQLKAYTAEREQKLYDGLKNFQEALPRIRKDGYQIVNAGTYAPKYKVSERQFQTGVDIIHKYLKDITFC